jgi:hypothetical protein
MSGALSLSGKKFITEVAVKQVQRKEDLLAGAG